MKSSLLPTGTIAGSRLPSWAALSVLILLVACGGGGSGGGDLSGGDTAGSGAGDTATAAADSGPAGDATTGGGDATTGGGDATTGGDDEQSGDEIPPDVCPDGTRTGSELCDTADVGARTCKDEGFLGGTLLCNSACTGYDTSQCLDGETCAEAVPLTQTETVAGDTTGASADHTVSCGDLAPDLVYLLSFAEPTGVTLTADGYDTILELRASPCDGGAVVGCNDDYPGSATFGSQLHFDLLDAGDYFLIVSGFVGSQVASGEFTLDVELVTGGYPRCGDGVVQSELLEVCDGTNYAGNDCQTFGWDGGQIGCDESCRTFDFSQCTTTAVCPNGAIDGPEVCDGDLLGGRSCESLGYGGGELVCAFDCMSFDESGCSGFPSCGDGVRQEASTGPRWGEGCDGAALPVFGGTIEVLACDDLGMGTGAVGCTDSCTVDFSDCQSSDYCDAIGAYGDGLCDPCDLLGGSRDVDCDNACGADGECADIFEPWAGVYVCQHAGLSDPDCAVCGDGVAELTESCDGADLRDRGCADLGYYGGGQLGCRSDCAFDVSGCLRCGDGIIETARAEICDGEAVGTKQCGDFGYDSGLVTCNAVCRGFDTSACVTSEVCGNDGVAGPEVCDGATVPQTCGGLGFRGGDLACADGCLSYDISDCFGFSSCGDGVASNLEVCDGTHFNSSVLFEIFGFGSPSPTCQDLGLGTGSVACTADCTIDIGGCSVSDYCAAFDYYGDGLCDLCELLGGDADSDCTSGCLRDGVCADFYDPLTQRRSCVAALGAEDPDCRRNCGDGLASLDEQCDGADLRSKNCSNFGFSGGSLGCRVDCVYDLSLCTP